MANVKHIDSDGFTQITQQTWPDAFSGRNQTPKKFAFQNVSDRALVNVSVQIQTVGASDGASLLRLAPDTDTVQGPYGVTASLSGPAAGGVWGTTGTKGWKVTSTTSIGESTAVMEVSVNVDTATKIVTLNWTVAPGATGYKVYRTDTPGNYGASTLRATIGSGATTTFVDNGSATSSGTPPSDNRTAGWLTSLALGASSGGNWVSSGTEFYRVVARDNTQVLLAAALENTIFVDTTSRVITVSWVTVPGANDYQVFRSLAAGVYNSPALVATILAPSTSYSDTGTGVLSGSLTQSPSYGIPPGTSSFTVLPLAIGTSLPVNLQAFYWANRAIPLATPEAGNPRVAIVAVKES
jgi:hypothetical protein